MPGGKVHGGGGHGQFSRELKRKYEHGQLAQEKIGRAKEKETRRVERKVEEVKEIMDSELNPVVSKAFERTTAAMKEGRASRRVAAIRMIAIEEWMKDSVIGELDRRRVLEPQEAADLRMKINVLPSEERERIMEELVGKNPTQFSLKGLQQDIQKWKQRVKGMAQGHY